MKEGRGVAFHWISNVCLLGSKRESKLLFPLFGITCEECSSLRAVSRRLVSSVPANSVKSSNVYRIAIAIHLGHSL